MINENPVSQEIPDARDQLDNQQPPVNRPNLKKTTLANDSNVTYERKGGNKPTQVNSVAKYGNMFARKQPANSDRNIY
jgi:hypothetical protein